MFSILVIPFRYQPSCAFIQHNGASKAQASPVADRNHKSHTDRLNKDHAENRERSRYDGRVNVVSSA